MSQGGDFSLIDLFQEEVRAHTTTLNAGLLELETDHANPRRIEPLMRAAHSIKGAARIIGIDLAVKLAHVLEDVFVAAQEGNISIAPADIDQLLRGTDILAELAAVNEESAPTWESRHAAQVGELCEVLDGVAHGTPSTAAPHAASTVVVATDAAPPPQPAAAAAPSASTAIDFAAICANIQRLQIPSEPRPPAEELSMLAVFAEEVREHCLTIQRGLLAAAVPNVDAACWEPLVDAVHAIRGGARIVGIAPTAQLALAMEELFARARVGTTTLDTADWHALSTALAIFIELIDISAESLPDWVARREPDIAALAQPWQIAADAQRGVKPSSTEAIVSAPESAVSHHVTPVAATTAAPVAPPGEAGAAPDPIASQDVMASAATPADTAATEKAAPAIAAEPAAAVVRVSAQSLNRLMGLAGESLVQARWLQPFSTALEKLKKHQDHVAGLLDSLSHALPSRGTQDDVAGLVEEARRGTASCRLVLAERLLEFDEHAAQAEDLNSRLYHEVIVSRMRPFADGAHGFPRMVRDMARQLNKQVRLEIDGLETEVDRDVLEKLEAPLTHLLRNAVDHGMETPEVRQAAGKPAGGLIKLEVRHRAGMLAITVADDGAGIDAERVRRKVIERGLSTDEMTRNMTSAEVLEFLFLPGFSTAGQVTEFSGRGVGLDVVQQAVRRIGGSVRVTSRPGHGATFHMQLPITLSVLRAVIVDIDGEPYAFPHNRIDRLLRVPARELRSLEGKQFITVDGQNVGVLLAAQLLGAAQPTSSAEEVTVVLLSDTTGQYGLIVDGFRGEQDLVVRPLDARLGKVPNLSAAAILEDGSPVLIADAEDLIRSMDQFIQHGVLRRHSREAAETGPKKRVLVVDDSITVREVERQILRNQGYDVTIAVDGQEGWNTVRAEPFDLVISDVDMPRMNGLELVQMIRADASLRNLPVIIVSYKERAEDRLKGLEVGANYYLTKSSFHDDTFLQAVRDCVGDA